MKLTIFIACFNEKSTILKTVQDAKNIRIDKEIIIIDNYSSDGTREILKGLNGDPDLKLIFHPKNMGSGYSACECIDLARGDYFYGPGADLEYRMDDVYKMMELAEKNNLDAVFGSRLAIRKDVSRVALIRERPYWLGSLISTFLINLFYTKNFTDIIATKLMKSSVLKSLGMEASNQGFEFELVSKLCKRGYKIGEVPVWYKPRTHKEGKTIRASDMIPAIAAILKVKFFN
jgi:glycosyltransferase involved in cell wall biosynthesis